MKPRIFLVAPLAFALAGCDPVPLQYPPGSAQYPQPVPGSTGTASTGSQPDPGISSSQRWQHAWGKAMEGVAMGGSIGGMYGAGGGLIIGLITGLLTADSFYGQINSQIQTEQQKDKQLESAIEQELERQRTLENQIAGASGSPAGGSSPTQPAASQNTPPPQPSTASASGSTRKNPAPSKQSDNTQLASIGTPAGPNIPAPPVTAPFKNVEVRDINGDGVPDLWIYYNPLKPGEILRQEEATKADGKVDTWSYFKDGKLMRREVDTKDAGRPDTVFYYDKDQIVREERDETGHGTASYRAFYQNGKLAKVERDTLGNGRTDTWTYYDSSRDGDLVVKEERDLNGDGVADMWTYFENGRVARRDVSAAGLEVLSKQEQLPIAGAEFKEAALSGN
jgi:hypothetical protein